MVLPLPIEAVAGAHATSESRAEAIWTGRRIEGRPLHFAPGANGVYFTPFQQGDCGGLRRYYRATPNQISEQYRLGDPRRGAASILFRLRADDQLVRSPTGTGPGEEAAIRDDVRIDVGERIAFHFLRSRPRGLRRNDDSDRSWSRDEVSEILVA
jgi:hypothetical protein